MESERRWNRGFTRRDADPEERTAKRQKVERQNEKASFEFQVSSFNGKKQKRWRPLISLMNTDGVDGTFGGSPGLLVLGDDVRAWTAGAVWARRGMRKIFPVGDRVIERPRFWFIVAGHRPALRRDRSRPNANGALQGAARWTLVQFNCKW